MPTVLHRITVDVKRGIEQNDPRWDFATSLYKNNTEIFAFWDTKTTKLPSRSDLRPFRKRKRQGIQEGERPGFAPSDEFLKSLTNDPNRPCRNVYPEEDRIAALRVVRRKKILETSEVERVRVVGNDVQKSTGTEGVIDTAVLDQGIETLLETNSFLLQSVNESFQEKFQIKETFGEPVFFAFGERQKIFQFDGILFDTESWAWKEKFLDVYERKLRGTKAIELNAFVTLITNSAVIQGFLLSCSVGQSINTHGYVALSFAMFVQDRFPISEIERSPQDQEDAEEEDPRVVLFQFNNETGKPDEIVKELTLNSPTVSLEAGFKDTVSDSIGQGFPFPPDFWAPITPVSGITLPIAIRTTTPPFGTSLEEFTEQPLPSQYVNQMMEGHLGVKGPNVRFQRKELQAPPASLDALEVPQTIVDPGGQSLEPLNARLLFPDGSISENILFGGRFTGGFTKHSSISVERLKAIADKGNLIARIRLFGESAFQDRKIAELRVPKRVGDFNFKAQGGAGFFGSNTNDVDANFEVQLESPIIPSSWGKSVFVKNDGFRIEWYEVNIFLVATNGSGFKIEGFYHSTLDAALVPNRLEKVADAQGTSLAVDQSARHVLEDGDAQFQTDLQAFFDAGDKITVTLPYAVIDTDSTSVESTEVPVTKIISQTKLQLGLLQLDVVNRTVPNKKIGPLPIGPYKVFVRRASGIQLQEAAIRKRIKNPPLGAFSVLNLNDPNQQLVQATGLFQMEKGVHFTE